MCLYAKAKLSTRGGLAFLLFVNHTKDLNKKVSVSAQEMELKT